MLIVWAVRHQIRHVK